MVSVPLQHEMFVQCYAPTTTCTNVHVCKWCQCFPQTVGRGGPINIHVQRSKHPVNTLEEIT